MSNFKNSMPSFMERLEELREARGISKKDMALRAGLSPGYISLLTRGSRISPSKEVVQDLAEALELDVQERIELFESAGYDASVAYLFNSKTRDQLSNRDWGEAPRIQMFRGRENEVERLRKWIVADSCQMISIVGIGGVGKTLLTTYIAEEIVQNDFDYILWRSVQNTPSIEKILKDCIYLFSGRQSKALTVLAELVDDVDKQIALLIDYLQAHRCLIILDNFESVLRVGSRSGNYREGYEKYGLLLQRIGEVKHKSCLVLTSREKPKEMLRIEGKDSHVRSMLLTGVELEDARIILQEKELQGTDTEWKQLIDLYSGNPLALKLVSESIRALFYGVISSFLRTGEAVFGDIHNLLDEQFSRLSDLERDIMYWIAIEREEVSFDELERELDRPVPNRALLEAVDSLLRRSLIETRKAATFTLQPVILEYVTNRFVEQVYREICDENVMTGLLSSHALKKAQAKDYIRDFQTDLILKPIATQLLAKFEQNGSEKKLKRILESLRVTPVGRSYAAGNILNLLVYLNVDLQGYDFSGLTVRQAYLQGVLLHNVNFTDADLSESVFTDTFGSIFSVALSMDGRILAAGTANGEIRLWNTASAAPIQTLQGHTEWVRSVAFSPKQNIIASASEDQAVRLWDANTGQCLNVLHGHTSRVYSVAFSPDGNIVASGSDDQTIRLWDVDTGECFKILHGNGSRVYSVIFSPNGDTVAAGSEDRTIQLWDANTGECFKILQGHTNRVRSVAFSPDRNTLASSSEDQTVRLWDATTGECFKILQGHTNRIWSVAFSPDCSKVASGSEDQSIRVWDTSTGECLQTLQKHGGRVHSVAFGPDGSTIASGSDGQIVRLWDVNTGECLRTLQGHGSRIYSVSFSPDGSTIASGSEDQIVRLWDASTGECFKTLHGHTHWVWSVVFGSKGIILASGSEDRTVRLWNVSTGECFRVLQGHGYRVFSVALSPDERIVASSSGDQTIKLWDVSTGECLKTLQGHNSRIYSVAFSPDGETIVSGSDDQTIKVWVTSTGECLKTLYGHSNRVRSVAFSPDGETIVSGSDDQTIKVWVTSTGECLKTLYGHSNWIWSVAFCSDGNTIASGSEDQTVKLWDVSTSECLKTLNDRERKIYSVAFSPEGNTIATGDQEGIIKIWGKKEGECLMTMRSDRPYERMNIRGVRGLTDDQKAMLKALGATEYQPYSY